MGAFTPHSLGTRGWQWLLSSAPDHSSCPVLLSYSSAGPHSLRPILYPPC